jgi:hypothetical protein
VYASVVREARGSAEGQVTVAQDGEPAGEGSGRRIHRVSRRGGGTI